jgi:DNA-directed RNA polymerase subunit RPC12/RpoP
MSHRKYTCTGCGKETGETEDQVLNNPQPCPDCGSMKRTLHLELHDELNLDIKESIRGKAKDDSYPSKDKVRRDFFHGDDLHKKTGKWNKKDRIIDKDNDHYHEVVKDPETGEIIHECEEPLSEHRGHGSAKNISDAKKA